MGKNRYNKWSVQKLRKVKDLREEGFTWEDISKIFSTTPNNLWKVYDYYRETLEEMDEGRESLITKALNHPTSKIIISTGISDRHIKEIIDFVLDLKSQEEK